MGRLGLSHPQDNPRHELLPTRDGHVETAHDRVADGDGGGMDFDQYFIVPGRRFFYLFELKNIRWSVFCRIQLLS